MIELTKEEASLWKYIDDFYSSKIYDPDKLGRDIFPKQQELTKMLLDRKACEARWDVIYKQPIDGRTKKSPWKRFLENSRGKNPILHCHWGYYYLPYLIGVTDNWKNDVRKIHTKM